MSTDEPDEYPHWRTALADENYVANLYCACKYVLWHTFHVLYVVTASLVMAVFIPAMIVYRLLRFLAIAAADRVGSQVEGSVSSRQVRNAQRRMRATTRSARETPVVRRIYGECPVDIKLDPKWFSGISDRAKALVQKLEPPEPRWVCDCDDATAWTFEPHRDECRWCESEYQKVTKASLENDDNEH